MSAVPFTAVTLAGDGPDADRWARALRGVEGVAVTRVAAGAGDDYLESLSQPDVAAVAFAGPISDLPAAIRSAVMAHRHVFVAGHVALTSRQLASLDELAKRRGRNIVFDTPSLASDHVAFVRKMVAGPNALWRPRYIRALRTGSLERRSIDDIVVHDVATVLALAGGMPVTVTAWAPRADDESGADDVAMLTLAFDGGMVARVDVSILEPQPRAEIAVACAGRTIVLETHDGAPLLRIDAAGRHRGPQRGGQWAETVTERPVGEATPAEVRVAEHFIGAVRRGAADATNARVLARAALVWETARMSIARGGEAIAPPTSSGLVEARRPALQLIHGGGQASSGHPVPELTVVGRR